MGLYKQCGCGREPEWPHTEHTKDWFIDYYYPPGRTGKRVREKVGPKKDEARIVLAKRLEDIRHGRNPELRRIEPKPFDDMVKEFLAKHVGVAVEIHREGATVQVKKVAGQPVSGLRKDPDGFLHNVNVLLRLFGDRTLQEITPKAIEEFIATRLAEGVSKATVNRQRACLSTIFNCAKRWGYYGGDNPVGGVKRFPEPTGRTRFLTAEEAQKLIDCSPRHLRPVIITALHTGGRLSEILSLRWSDIDLDRGVLYFDQRNTKSGKQREVPIDPVLTEVLRERRKVRAIGGDAREFIFTRFGNRLRDVRTAFDAAREKADLGEDVTFHTLRHSFASWYVINGGDPYRLQRYLGHSTITLTQRYAHLSPDYLRAGVQFFGPPAASRGHSVDTGGQVLVPPDRASG